MLWLPNHPNAEKCGAILEHRLIMSNFLGRPLLPTEIVHHINRDPKDNQIENLKLLKSKGVHNHEHRPPMTIKEKNEITYKWRRENPEKLREINRRYREKHKEQIKKSMKKYNELNSERLKEYKRIKYYKEKSILGGIT
jgi:hypothetical protein